MVRSQPIPRTVPTTAAATTTALVRVFIEISFFEWGVYSRFEPKSPACRVEAASPRGSICRPQDRVNVFGAEHGSRRTSAAGPVLDRHDTVTCGSFLRQSKPG